MADYFGPAYHTQIDKIIGAWRKTHDLIREYNSAYPGHSKFNRATQDTSGNLAEIWADDFEGRIFLHDNFFNAGLSRQVQALTLIHELTHLRRASKIKSVGVGTQDFFILHDDNPSADSINIVTQGRLTAEELKDPEGLFQEIAESQSLEVKHIDENLMTYSIQGTNSYMVKGDAIKFFNNTPTLRARIAAKNADSIAYSAIKMAARL